MTYDTHIIVSILLYKLYRTIRRITLYNIVPMKRFFHSITCFRDIHQHSFRFHFLLQNLSFYYSINVLRIQIKRAPGFAMCRVAAIVFRDNPAARNSKMRFTLILLAIIINLPSALTLIYVYYEPVPE